MLTAAIHKCRDRGSAPSIVPGWYPCTCTKSTERETRAWTGACLQLLSSFEARGRILMSYFAHSSWCLGKPNFPNGSACSYSWKVARGFPRGCACSRSLNHVVDRMFRLYDCGTFPKRSCVHLPSHLSVTMSRTAPRVEVWLHIRAKRPSSSSQAKLTK